MKKEDQSLLIKAGVIGLGYFVILKPILNKLGITKSAADRVIETVTNKPNTENPFSPVFHQKAPAGALLLTTATALNYATRIHKAMGYFYDDEAEVNAVFRSLKSQSQVSMLADKFQQKYGEDLLEYLKRGANQFNFASGLSDTELQNIINIVQSLPKYK